MDRFLTIEDLGNLPAPKWLIDGLFEQDALVMLYGPPGSFKSFLAIDWALCLASGRPWNGRVVAPSRVLYMLGEGKASLLKRIKAWVYHNGLSRAEEARLNANFRVTFEVPQLAIPREASEFTDELIEDGFDPTTVIIDTLARSYVGKSENDPMDTGLWIESVDALRQRGITVLVLHHTRKNTEFGLQYRGSTAWMGAMDTAFVLERNPEGYKGYSKLNCSKQKDHQEPPDIWLQSAQIRLPEALEGSIVLQEVGRPGEAEEEALRAEEEALEAIINGLLADPTFTSDRVRARQLATGTGLPEATANTKINRARKRIPDISAKIEVEPNAG